MKIEQLMVTVAADHLPETEAATATRSLRNGGLFKKTRCLLAELILPMVRDEVFLYESVSMLASGQRPIDTPKRPSFIFLNTFSTNFCGPPMSPDIFVHVLCTPHYVWIALKLTCFMSDHL